MKAFHRKRLLKLIRHLERGKLGHPVFDFGTWDEGKRVNGCRTNGCALGECPVVFPKYWKFRKSSLYTNASIPILKIRIRTTEPNLLYVDKVVLSASIFFGVTYNEAYKLFTPDGANLSYRAKRTTVAKHLRKFLKQ